ncbi:MAG TPA: tRNA isopentenyl-2-thiomethyl-A-37 hydroxylase MiaE [Steroidobacteraceae bacterium]|nr:tRNA isopentenyl-2-thiomethyl-A-37 hydroxylase MiaE [Steroidobacteraceae bacterium]
MSGAAASEAAVAGQGPAQGPGPGRGSVRGPAAGPPGTDASTVLLAPTPPSWVQAACERWQELLLDHLACEKKAASTALALIFAYPEERGMCAALSRLAREELRHFEQVQALAQALGVPERRLRPGRYAAGLRAACRTAEPQRRVDLMLAGALIEARSAERFALLAPRLRSPLAQFYGQLALSETRHFTLYLGLAQQGAAAAGVDLPARLRHLAQREAELATAPDPEFRFHSGPPALGG